MLRRSPGLPQRRTRGGKRLPAREMSQGDLAERLSTQRENINRALSGRSGEIPVLWVKMLDVLDLELIAVPRNSLTK
jgi:ribosome-binding protein aMBF1 (putative translation factor)